MSGGLGLSNASRAIIEVDHVCKSFHRRTILDDIFLSVQEGETVGIVGGNGSGSPCSFS